MVRTSLAAALCTALVSVGVATGPGSAAAVRADDVHPEWGSTHADDGVLKRGCHKYAYSYSVDPPPGDWALEVFIDGPGGKHLTSTVFVGGYDPEAGPGSYTLCKASTRPGRFTIRAKLSAQDSDQLVEGWLPPSHFRLRAPKRH